jgi:hypothetical protein
MTVTIAIPNKNVTNRDSTTERLYLIKMKNDTEDKYFTMIIFIYINFYKFYFEEFAIKRVN